MSLTPVEIRHLQLSRTFLRGYRKPGVDRLLSEIADSFEEVWRERADLADRLDEIETEVSKHRELEALLRSTLVSAERASHEMKEQARRESDLIVQEAHAEGRRVAREAGAEKQRLEEDIRRIRAMLRTALEQLDGGRVLPELQAEAQPQRPTQPQPQAQPQAAQASEQHGLIEELTDSGIRKVAS
jgi:cell division initiation protein